MNNKIKDFEKLWNKVLNGKKVRKKNNGNYISTYLYRKQIVLEFCGEVVETFSVIEKQLFFNKLIEFNIF